MANWVGLDSAGVEQLWDDTLLLGTLEVMAENQPFSSGDPYSPIYPDLIERFPDVTWSKGGAGTDFRPIFRRGNPLAKLGLIEGHSQQAYLSQFGQELISGETTLETIYQLTLRSFSERDGTRSFAKMCAAAIKLPQHAFTLVDVEFGVAEANDQLTDLVERLKLIRERNLRFPAGSRRDRVLRSFMNALVSSGALVNVEGGWILADPAVAVEIIASRSEIPEQMLDVGFHAVPVPASRNRGLSFPVVVVSPGARPIATIRSDAFAVIDSSQRSLLLERAHSEHERLIELAAASIRRSGGTPIEGTASFDVGCNDVASLLIEAKHVTDRNAVSQFRKAVAQLPEYRWRHRNLFGPETRQIVALSTDPRSMIEPDFMDFVETDRDIEIIWRDADRLVDKQGQDFQVERPHSE